MYNIEIQKQIINAYILGSPLGKIRGDFKISKNAVKRILLENGVVLRTQSHQQRLNSGNSSLNEKAFDNLNDESLYWLGFLYADGSIRRDAYRYVISCDLNTVDKYHLQQFLDFISANNRIGDQIRKRNGKEYKTSSFQISSQDLYESLVKWGFTVDKTYTGHVHPELGKSRDFWRGVVDGDGWVSRNINKKKDTYAWWVGLCGTKATVQAFIDFIIESGIESTLRSPRQKKNCSVNYETAFVGSTGVKVADLLYEGATLYLDRKHKLYLEMKEECGRELTYESNAGYKNTLRVTNVTGEETLKLHYTIKHWSNDYKYKNILVGTELVDVSNSGCCLRVLEHKGTYLTCEYVSSRVQIVLNTFLKIKT